MDYDEVPPKVALTELENAMMWVSGDPLHRNAAYVCRTTGKVYWQSEDEAIQDDEEVVPDDLQDETRFARVPRERDLALGQQVVFDFIEEHCPQLFDEVRQAFAHRGAYARLRSLLQHHGLLDAWHAYEEQAGRKALQDWARSEGLRVVEDRPVRG